MRPDKVLYKAISGTASISLFGSLIICALIIGNQVLKWVKFAIWVPYTIRQALYDLGSPIPSMPHLLGVQKIIDAVLSWPAVVGCFGITLLSVFIVGLAVSRLDEIESQERAEQRRREAAEREKTRREEALQQAERSKADMDFQVQIDELLGPRR